MSPRGRAPKVLTSEEETARAEERRRQNAARQAAYRARQCAAIPAAPEPKRIDQVEGEDRALIAEYINARSTRLLGASQEAYEADLAIFALDRGQEGLLTATHTEIATWLASNTRDPKNPDDPRPWSRRTARRKLSALQGFYRWAVRERRIEGNPAAGIEIARTRSATPVRLSVSEVARLFAHIEDQIQLRPPRSALLYLLDLFVLRLMYHLGLRVSEATTLRLSQIRIEEGELRAYPVKKGDKEKGYPLTGLVLDAYERWIARRADLPIAPGHEDFLCIHPWHGKRVQRRRAWRRIRRLATEAGLPREQLRIMSPHKLRHAIAYHMLDAGHTIAEVQSLLDHESITSTEAYIRSDERARLQTLRRASNAIQASNQ